MNLKRQLSYAEGDAPTVHEESNQTTQDLVDAQTLELEIRTFFKTPVGKYLMERLLEDKERAKLKLVSIPAHEWKNIRMAQEEYEMPHKIEQYLAHALIAGANANEALKQIRTSDYNN